MADLSDLLTVSEAATVAGVSDRTMRRWVNIGHVRTVGNGHRRRVVATSLSDLAGAGQIGHEKLSERPTVSDETVASANVATADTEAGHLADLVRELSDQLADQRALTMLWMERARVLGEQLALAAPAPQRSDHPTVEASGAVGWSDCTPEPAAPFWRRVGRVLAAAYGW